MVRRMKKTLACLMAMALSIAGADNLASLNGADISADAADTGSRILVDINKNDGRKASYARFANNWIVDDSAAATFNGVTFKLSASGGDLRMENNKKLQLQNLDYPYLTMDGATVDASSGGTLTLTITGLSEGSHSIKTYHSNTNANGSTGDITLKVNGTIAMTGIKCPNTVKDSEDAGIGYATFSGTSATIEISSASGNAWLNAFEIDGGDPIKGVSHISPADKESHHDRSEGLTWTAGVDAKSHDVYIGTSYDSVFSATTNSPEYKGNQTGTTYALDETYQSYITYYWRVDTVDSSGNVIKGSVNSFNVARLAFPSAEGYGRFARGGQGGVVVHVTNLKDDGSEGSLRWALCDEQWTTDDWKGVPRIVVFDVGGVIELQDTLCIPDNAGSVYIAGQTAPGDGITLTKYDFGAMGTSDVIIRDIRVRMGDSNGSSHGGMGMGSCNHSIVDHCSISWATDEGFSSRSSANITFQWNIIGESLNNSVHYNSDDRTQTERHAFAASISGYTGSYHHNLLINCTGRNWSLAGGVEQDGATYGGQADIRNNVVYNWKDRTTDGGVRRLNFVNNYYKAGAVSNTDMHIVSTDGNELGYNDMQKMYVSGNVMVDTNGSYLLKASDNAWDNGKAVSGGKNSTDSDVRSDTQFFESYVNTQSAEDAYKSVIANVGAGGTSATGWDYIDSRYIDEVKNGTYTYTGSKDGLKGIIDSQEDVGGYPTSENFQHSTDGATNAANDTDRDGMPNTWETEHGLDPSDPSDGAINSLSPDGYTNIEMYLNELAGDEVVYGTPPVIGKTGAVLDTAYTYRFKNENSGFYMEVAGSEAANGANVQQGTTGARDWYLEDAGNGYYMIYSEVGDKKTYLLDIDYGKTDNGTNIGIYQNTNCTAQYFKFVDNGDGTYTICTAPTNDESCIGVAAGSKEEGANVVQWKCNGSDDQKWIIETSLPAITGGSLISEVVPLAAEYCSNWSIDTSLAVGDLVFKDREVAFITIPDKLLGAEYVLTPCDAKSLTTDVATLTSGDDITLYVGLDSRTIASYGVPSWMSNWKNTGFTAVNSNDVTFNLYSTDLAKGETIVLGQNGGSAGCVFYTVMAVKQQSALQAVTYDVTCDGNINIFDLMFIKSYVRGNAQLSEQALLNADINGDGNITITDIVAVQKKLLGLE